MNKILLSTLLSCMAVFSTASISADSHGMEDPKVWYSDGYAPLWKDRPAERLDEMLEYYAESVQVHRVDGDSNQLEARDMLGGSMNAWTEEGWLRSELSGLLVDRINDSTVVFKARWIDHYEAIPQEVSCGWYLADHSDGNWLFSAYADMDCEGHGF